MILWLGGHLFAPVVSFKVILAATSFAHLVIIPELVIKTPLILARKSFEFYLGPAAFLPRAWHGSSLFNLLEQFDIFTVWMLVLLILGIPIMANINPKQAALLVGVLYVFKLTQSIFLNNLIQVV